MRRLELLGLKLYDLDVERETVIVRQGKKDRMIPIGSRALYWIDRYVTEIRPSLVLEPHDGTLFLSSLGETFTPKPAHTAGARLRRCGPARQTRQLSPVPAHHGDPDARKRGRYPLYPGNARARQTRHHPDVDPAIKGDPLRDATCQARTKNF
jgi:hypothetical protein